MMTETKPRKKLRSAELENSSLEPQLQPMAYVPPFIVPPVDAPANKSQAIRRALTELGDPDAPAVAVKELILKAWPQFKDEIESDKHWNQNVSQNRKRAATRNLPTDSITAEDVRAARQLAQKLGTNDLEQLREIIQVIKRFGSVERASRVLEAWAAMVKAANGDEQIAERMLSVIEENRVAP